MTSRQAELADRLFADAVGLPREQQPIFLADHCLDPDVRREVESLLAFASRPPAGIVEAIQQAAGSVASPDLIGLRVGPYRLTGRIGQGGMGAVYRAVRDDDQFQKTVAVKMLYFADGDPAMRERFRQERQILASLEHPHIARLLDGGAEPQPYIVMEYVDGLPLTTYCEQEQVTVAQRLRLFRRVCDALSYAHRQLVVHRDVKPGNILVTADGTPKLLDFGVSKLLNPGGSTTTVTAGFAAMTPDYASPEQVRGEPVSTLTDVYSLGAVLYELLAGRRPHRLATHDPLEIAREICEREVAPPGVNSELDLIVLKAMHQEPTRRYQSVEQFSEDIRRYLERLPILARPDTLAYRAAKFVRRHRWGVAAAATVFVALVGGIAVSAWEARRADTEAATAKAVNEFLQNDLLAQARAGAQSGPTTKPDPDLKVRIALDRAAARIGGKFAKQPLVEAAIRRTMARAYLDLGLYAEAQKQAERALAIRRPALGEEHPGTVQSLNDLADLQEVQGEYGKAEQLFAKVVAIRRRTLGGHHRDTLAAMNGLAAAYMREGKYTQAEAVFTQVLAAQRPGRDKLETMTNLGTLYDLEGRYREEAALFTQVFDTKRQLLGEEHPDTLLSLNDLAVAYRKNGEFDKAGAAYSRALAALGRVLGEEHPDTLLTMGNLAVLYASEAKYDQAEPLFATVVSIRRRMLGEEHPATLSGMHSLGNVYSAEKKYTEAALVLTRVLGARQRVLGAEHPATLNTMDSLAKLDRRQHKYPEAEALYRRVLALRRRVLGPQHPDTIGTEVSLGGILLDQQKYAEAESPLREALGNYEHENSGSWSRYDTQSLLGASLAGQKEYAKAEPLLLAGYRGLLERRNAIAADSRSSLEQARERLVRFYADWGKPAEAAAWRAKLP